VKSYREDLNPKQMEISPANPDFPYLLDALAYALKRVTKTFKTLAYTFNA